MLSVERRSFKDIKNPESVQFLPEREAKSDEENKSDVDKGDKSQDRSEIEQSVINLDSQNESEEEGSDLENSKDI